MCSQKFEKTSRQTGERMSAKNDRPPALVFNLIQTSSTEKGVNQDSNTLRYIKREKADFSQHNFSRILINGTSAD